MTEENRIAALERRVLELERNMARVARIVAVLSGVPENAIDAEVRRGIREDLERHASDTASVPDPK
jgi:hypothetical protein